MHSSAPAAPTAAVSTSPPSPSASSPPRSSWVRSCLPRVACAAVPSARARWRLTACSASTSTPTASWWTAMRTRPRARPARRARARARAPAVPLCAPAAPAAATTRRWSRRCRRAATTRTTWWPRTTTPSSRLPPSWQAPTAARPRARLASQHRATRTTRASTAATLGGRWLASAARVRVASAAMRCARPCVPSRAAATAASAMTRPTWTARMWVPPAAPRMAATATAAWAACAAADDWHARATVARRARLRPSRTTSARACPALSRTELALAPALPGARTASCRDSGLILERWLGGHD
mmetsp:Transcript_102999/g.286903  ORF Transcript_102999/g.286903 Transcript_102999/m.286903 type:complete len:299 (-) Transcript_102999:309-1205(-)